MVQVGDVVRLFGESQPYVVEYVDCVYTRNGPTLAEVMLDDGRFISEMQIEWVSIPD